MRWKPEDVDFIQEPYPGFIAELCTELNRPIVFPIVEDSGVRSKLKGLLGQLTPPEIELLDELIWSEGTQKHRREKNG